VVDPGVGSSRKAIAVETENYFFVAPDNGVTSQAIKCENVRKVVELKERAYFCPNVSQTFHGRDIFAPVSAYISLGTPLEKFGPEVKRIKKLSQIPPRVSQKKIVGRIVYIDRFGNLITDISQEIFEKAGLGRDFVIKFKGREIGSLSRSYSDIKVGAYSHTPSDIGAVREPPLLALFDSFEVLEIAVNQGSAEEVCQAKIGDEVEIEFM
jgi:S-adenosylmethionine hydrolase